MRMLHERVRMLTAHRCCRVGDILPVVCVCRTGCTCSCAGCICG